MYLYLSLAMTVSAGIGFVYGLVRFFRDDSALYVRMIILSVGCAMFGRLFETLQYLVNGELDTGKVAAFRCPAGTLIEVYATTLHYAPCNAAKDAGFKTIVVLPKGTNLDKPEIAVKNAEDEILWASNKWLLAHAESSEAAQGASVSPSCRFIGITTSLTKAGTRPASAG